MRQTNSWRLGVIVPCFIDSRTDGGGTGRRKVAIHPDGCQRDRDTLPLPGPPLTVGLDGGFTPRSRIPWQGLVRSHRGQEHARGRRCEMLCLTPDLRHKAEAAVVRTDEITRAPGQSAGDLPVRRCGRRAGVAVVSEPGVRALARSVSRRDAAQGNGANGQRVGERAEHDISTGAT